MRKQKGAVLIVSLIMLMLITILATSAMTQSNLQIIMAKNYQDNMTAFQSAENGLVMGRNDLQADFAAVKAEFEATGYERLDISIGGPQSFSYEILSMDLINEDTITIVNVKSTGRMNNSTRTVHGIYAHVELPLDIGAALSLYNTGAVTLRGDAEISGYDHDVPTDFDCNGASGCAGSDVVGSDVIGIYADGDLADLELIGSPLLEGSPITQEGGSSYDEAYWTSFGEGIIPHADSINRDNGWGTRDNPIVHVINQDTNIVGNVDGAGVLVVNCSCSISIGGNFHFEGMILYISTGALDVTIGGTANIFGSMVTVGPNVDIEVGSSGTPGIMYSTAALQNLLDINTLSARAWFEEM